MLLQGSTQQDILLYFPEHGLHLIFDGASQMLRLIEVLDLSRVQVVSESSSQASTDAASMNAAGSHIVVHGNSMLLSGILDFHWHMSCTALPL